MMTIVAGFAMLSDAGAGSLLIMVLPFAVGFLCALVGLALVALPMTLWLRKRGAESRQAYLTGGMVAGGAITLAFMLWLADGEPFAAFFLGAFGAFTGGATGQFWWRYAREKEVHSGLDTITEVFG